MRNYAALPLILLLVGCAGTRTYDVSVRNDTPDPITIGLTKEGGPVEAAWTSPEDAAINGQEPSAHMWAAIPAGKTAETGPIKGRFRSDSQAVLRVYSGNLNLSGILAISRGQPNRLDVPLHPGSNQFTISEEGAQLTVARNEPFRGQLSQ